MAAGYSVVVSATDNATKTITAINKQLQQLRAPTERLSASLGRFSRLSGLSDLAGGMKRLGHNAFDAFRNITQILGPLGALTGAASLAGMYRLVSTWGLWAQHQDTTSKRIGISANKLQEFENAGRLSGASVSAMDDGLKTLADNLYKMSNGLADNETVQMFRNLGLGVDFAREHVGDAAGAFEEIRKRIGAINQPLLQSRVGTALLGGSFEELLPIMRLTAEEWAKQRAAVARHANLTEDDRKALIAFQQAQTTTQEAVEGFTQKISAGVAGPLTDLLNWFTNIIDANRDWIAVKANEYMREFVDWVKGVNWKKVGEEIASVAGDMGNFASGLAGAIGWMDKMVGTTTLLSAALVVRFLGPLLSILNVLTKIGAFTPPAWLAALAVLATKGDIAAATRPVQDEKGNTVGYGGNAGMDGIPMLPLSPAPTSNGAAPGSEGLLTRLYQRYFGGTPYDHDTHYHGPNPDQGAKWDYDAGTTQGEGPQRNLRNNNPTNLSFANQPGAVSDGRFARFKSLESGVAADLNQYLLYQDRDKLTSLQDMIHKATPASDNPGVEDYINRVANTMGIKRDQPVNLHDPATAAKFILAVSPNEGGTPDAGAVQRGVNLRLGIPNPPAPAAVGAPAVIAPSAPGGSGAKDTPPPSGTANVNVTFANMPPGAKATGHSSGSLFNGPPLIRYSMPGAGIAAPA